MKNEKLIKRLKQLDKQGTKLVLDQFYKTETGKKNFQGVVDEMVLISKKLNWDSEQLGLFLNEQVKEYFKNK